MSRYGRFLEYKDVHPLAYDKEDLEFEAYPVPKLHKSRSSVIKSKYFLQQKPSLVSLPSIVKKEDTIELTNINITKKKGKMDKS